MAHFGLDRTVLKRKETSRFSYSTAAATPENLYYCAEREREKSSSSNTALLGIWLAAGRVISKLALMLTLMEYYSLMYSPARPQGQEYIIRSSAAASGN
jgi:hypothetical protein